MERVGQQQGKKDEQIFCPLVDPESFRQGSGQARAVQELPAYGYFRLSEPCSTG